MKTFNFFLPLLFPLFLGNQSPSYIAGNALSDGLISDKRWSEVCFSEQAGTKGI